MKNYIILAAISVILFLLATSMMTVAVGLLVKETYKASVIVYDQLVEGAIQVKEMWEFCKLSGSGVTVI
jgi:hypothetical protein